MEDVPQPQPEQLSKDQEEFLQLFRSFFRHTQKAEMTAGKSVHLKDINPDELVWADYEMHNRVIKIGPEVSIGELIEYQKQVSGNHSRELFAAYLANKLQGKQKVPGQAS